jgi:hypothetical protein
MRPFAPLLLSLSTTAAFAALPPLRAQQTPLPGPTFDERDIQVVRRGDKPPTNRGTKVALVVGIDRYKYLPKLDYADKDAKDVGAALQGLGFVVRTLRMEGEQTPANAITILGALDELCTAADPQDTIVVFLSGHGFSESGGKEGFFCAHFTDPEKLTTTGLSLDEVRRRLVASKAKQRMLIVDACRNVPGARTVGAKLEIGEAFRAEGLGVLFSTSPGTQSLEPRGIDQDAQGRTIQNGIFTHYLLRGLEGDADSNGDGWLTFRELAYHTWSEVKAKTELKQKPYLDWVGEAGGDFLLRQVPVRAVAVPSALSVALVPPTPPAAAASTPTAPRVVVAQQIEVAERSTQPLLARVDPPDFSLRPDFDGAALEVRRVADGEFSVCARERAADGVAQVRWLREDSSDRTVLAVTNVAISARDDMTAFTGEPTAVLVGGVLQLRARIIDVDSPLPKDCRWVVDGVNRWRGAPTAAGDLDVNLPWPDATPRVATVSAGTLVKNVVVIPPPASAPSAPVNSGTIYIDIDAAYGQDVGDRERFVDVATIMLKAADASLRFVARREEAEHVLRLAAVKADGHWQLAATLGGLQTNVALIEAVAARGRRADAPETYYGALRERIMATRVEQPELDLRWGTWRNLAKSLSAKLRGQ